MITGIKKTPQVQQLLMCTNSKLSLSYNEKLVMIVTFDHLRGKSIVEMSGGRRHSTGASFVPGGV
jgi:hypothetical protein